MSGKKLSKEDLDFIKLQYGQINTHSCNSLSGDRSWDPFKQYNDRIEQSHAIPYVCLRCHKEFPDRKYAWGQPDRGVCFCSWECWQQDLGNPDAFK